jgi:aspartate aminotransferase
MLPGISGVPEFVTHAQNLVFGQGSSVVKSGQVVSAQALSGTGALRIGTDFLRRFLPEVKNVYLPNPTWGNHIPIANDAGFGVSSYRYYDASTIALDQQGLYEDIDTAPNGSIFLFHVCAHNPTGVDPTQEQWTKISEICKKKGHFIFFDMAYQGFASGDPERDVWPVRHFIEQGHRPLIAQSFAKNFGLYGERIGAVHIMTDGATESACVDSQLKIIIRPHYSNPPIGGARLVNAILSDAELTAQWRKDVKVMADRIIKMRELLVKNLKAAGSKRDWSHVTKQIGMFCYSGLTPAECDELASKYHIYMTRNGRISMAGVTSSTVEYLAKSIAEVTKFQ